MSSSQRRVAVVTGASAGIGRATAIALGHAGWSVVITARRKEQLDETASQIKSCHTVVADLTHPTAVEQLFSEAVYAFERVDLLFNNAGLSSGASSLEELSVADFTQTINVNLIATFSCMKRCFMQMKSQVPQGGRIINNGSISAHTPRPGSAAYTASKHGISGLTKQTGALDGRKYNIACGQIDIGNTATDMAQRMTFGAPQPDGSLKVEPLFDVQHVASSIVHMASLPLDVNILFQTIMATKMPSMVGRG
ncbi:MAG: hypothetical protein CYPHOPRED_002674 [Cyphobasidiales sp. Tagirdzhanova-0007]|nr:MAG: hypothetical protein CYPHOPRED_002674 [Cyphobasidiales sp. Tagirdzhanova-0007]